jgi:superfamily II DNA or RNA helicase
MLNVEPGFASLKFPFHPKMIGALKKYPGCRWHAQRGAWIVPNELARPMLSFAEGEFGWQSSFDDDQGQDDYESRVNPAAYQYQKQDIAKALRLKRAMLAWEMGLGKTLGGIEFIRLSQTKRVLVVCPAMARGVWEQDLKRWWPEHHPLIVVRDGKEAANFALRAEDTWICVTSYELLAKVRFPAGLQCVVADESHYIKTAKIGRSKALRSVLDAHRVDYRLWLTGTPITINPIDVHHQVDSLYPGRLGHYNAFGDIYCGRKPNGYRYRGYDYDGVNPARGDELLQRLQAFIFRRTKAEVAAQLPTLITQTIRLKPSRKTEKEVLALIRNGNASDTILLQAGNEKIDPIIDMVREDFMGGATHVNLSTYFQVTADELAGRLQDAIGTWEQKPIVFHVDGKVPEKKRQAIIAEAKKQPLAILVNTMMSVNVGINLTKFSPSYCAELYSAPGIMGQWAGRFHRVGGESDKPVVRFVVLEGTEEEIIARTLERRMKEHGKVVPKGLVDKAIIEAMEEDNETPAQFLKRIRAAVAKGTVEEDAYAG